MENEICSRSLTADDFDHAVDGDAMITLVDKSVKRTWWFGYRIEWYVKYELAECGPFKSYEKAYKFYTIVIDSYRASV